MKIKYLDSGRKSIILLLLLFVSYALIYMTKNCYAAAMAVIVEEGVMTKSETGLISAIFYLIYAPFQIVGGIAADRLSPKWLIVLGALGGALANILIYFIDGYVMMIVIWSFNAIVQFGVWPSIFKIITTELMPSHRNAGIFFINISSAVGLLISYAFAAFIMNWKDNFLFSAISLVAVAISFLLIYGSLEKSMKHEEIKAPIKETAIESCGNRLSLIIKSGVPLLLFVSFFQNAINLGIKGLTPVMLLENYESVSVSLANGLNIILVISAPVGVILASLLCRVCKSMPILISLYTLASIPLLFVVSFIGKTGVGIVVMSLALVVIFTSATQLSFSHISRSFARYGCVGTLSGLFNCAASLGIVAWNYGFIKLADSFGWGFTTKGWIVITVISLFLSLISIPIWKRFSEKA